jgi:hypothetical protein
MKEPIVNQDSQDQPIPTEPVATAPVVARKRRGASVLNLALGGALVLAVAGVAFAAGRMTAGATSFAGTFPNGQAGGPIFNGNGGNGTPGGGPVGVDGGGPTIEGTVESITDTTLTIKTVSGETVQVALDDTTTYHAQSDASSDDVVTGGKVLVRVNGRAPGPTASGTGTGVTGPTANDVTVVP